MAVGPISVGNRASRLIIGIVLIAVITLVMATVLTQTLPGIIADFKAQIADGNGETVAVVIGLTALLTLILSGAVVWAFCKDGDRIAALFLPQDKDDAR